MQTNKVSSTSNDRPIWGDILRATPTGSNMVFIPDTCNDGFEKDPVFLNGSESQDKSESNRRSGESSPNIFLEWDMNAEAGNSSADMHIPLSAENPTFLTPPHLMINDENLKCDQVSELPRQASLAVALEVLGSVAETGHVLEGFYPPTPSPSDHLSEHCLQHPSPSMLAFGDRLVSSEQTCSSHCDVGPVQSPNTKATFFLYDETAGCSDNNENETESSGKSVCNGTSTTTTTQVQADNPPPMQSLSSFIIQTIENPVVTDVPDSLDMDGILQEFLESTDKSPKKPEKVDRRKSKRLVEADHSYSAKPIVITDTSASHSAEPCPSPKPASNARVSVVVDLTENSSSSSSTPRLVRTPSYVKRRQENNRACRQSRMKRKAEREEAEGKVKFFLKDNEEQKAKIKQLEKEVKEARTLLVSRMTKKP